MSRDSSTRIIAEANAALSDWERQTTGQHKALVLDLVKRHAHASKSKWIWGVLGAVASALILGAVVWMWGAVTDKAKALITADLAEKVESQNTANNDAHGVLTKSIGEVKVDLADKGDLLDALYQVQIDGVKPSAAKAKVAKRRAARAAQPKDNP